MIGCFPDPYPDETLYSLCARYAERVHYDRDAQALGELFGSRQGHTSTTFHGGLEHLIAALPPRHPYTVEKLLGQYTLLPYYRPFFPDARRIHLSEEVHGSRELIFGCTANCHWKGRSTRLHLCPACVEMDRQQRGECYWHRLHQAPGVVLCPVHQVLLERVDLKEEHKPVGLRLLTAEYGAERKQASKVALTPLDTDILTQLSWDIAWLLRQHNLTPDSSWLYKGYHQLLFQLHLSRRYFGYVYLQQLLARFHTFYSPTVLQLLDCEVDEHYLCNWLFRLIRDVETYRPPLHHLLLMRCLGCPAEAFFTWIMPQ